MVDTSLVKPRTTVPEIPVSADTAIGTELPVVGLLPTATVPSYKMLCHKGMLAAATQFLNKV